MNRFSGRTAIVTGAASGIGKAILERLVAEGANVLAVDRQEEGLAPLVQPGRVAALTCNVGAEDAPALILTEAQARFGAVDLLVNNAGRGDGRAAHDTSDRDWDAIFSVNLRAAFRLSRDALAVMRAPGGAILNIASATALRGYPSQASYSAAKAGMIGMTRQMAVDYAGRGLRINAIAPGIVETGMTAAKLHDRQWRATVVGVSPMNRPGTAAEVAGAAAFLLSDDAGFVTGQVLAVDGGASSSNFIAPEILDAWIAHG